MPSDKVIVSCAVTGAIHVPSQSDALPTTPGEIAKQAIGAAGAGAAIVHLHARDPQTGAPTHRPEVFAEFLPEIHSGCDAVINITTGGGHGMSLEERTAAATAVRARAVLAEHGQHELRHLPHGRRDHELQARLGTRLSGDDAGLHLPQHLQGHRDRRGHARCAWNPIRVRVLRRRSPVHARPFP